MDHVWRPPGPGEPMEEGGVCIVCGCWATAEADTACPAPIESVEDHSPRKDGLP